MKKEFRKKTVSTATKIPAYTVGKKKKFDLKKDLPAYILLVLFIFWTIGSIFGIIAYQRNKGISASADEYNPADYPYANYFNPYEEKYSGLAYATDINPYSITVDSDRKDLAYCSLNIPLVGVKYNDYCYIRGTMSSTGNNTPVIRIQYCDGNLGVGTPFVNYHSGYNGSPISFRILTDKPTENAVLCVSLYYQYGNAISSNYGTCTYENVMITVGTTTVSFSPNFNAVAEQARQEGYAQGEEDGYEQGRIDGLKKGDISFLVGAKAKAIYALSSNFEEETAYYESNASGGTVAFDKLYNALPAGTYSYLNVTVDFASPVFGRNLYLNAYGNRGIFYDGDEPKVFTAITEDGQRLNARFVYNESEDNYGLELQISSFDFYLVRLEAIPVATRSNLDTFSLRVPNSSYREGYNDGYNVGVKDNSTLQEQYELGLSQGFSQGKVIGYNEGIEDANTYTFTNLLGSVFDVPIQAFNGLLNFEVLGVNLRGFYLSLLTACLVLVIIRLFI